MIGIWQGLREEILNSRRLTRLFLPHLLRIRPPENSQVDHSAVRLRIVIHLVMVMVFGGCALVQLNDPDPALWIPIYAVPCLACVLDALCGYTFELLMGSVLALLHVIYCIGVTMSTLTFFSLLYEDMTSEMMHEYMREFCGLFMVLLWHLHTFISLNRQVTVLRKLETGMAYAIINIILLVAAWICFPHTEQSKGQPITASANASELA